MPIMGKTKSNIWVFLWSLFSINACPHPLHLCLFSLALHLQVWGLASMAPHCASHLTWLSVLMCEMKELNYMITKFPSGSDILSFICINTDSYISTQVLWKLYGILSYKVSWTFFLKHSLLSIRLKIIPQFTNWKGIILLKDTHFKSSLESLWFFMRF